MVDGFLKSLESRGYVKVGKVTNNSILYARTENFSAHLVICIADDGKTGPDVAAVKSVRSYCTNLYAQKNYTQINALTVIYTARAEDFREMVQNIPALWIADAVNIRVLVFENQPQDFDGIRSFLQQDLEASASQVHHQETSDTNKRPKRSFSEFVRHQGLFNLVIIAINVIVFFVLEMIGDTTNAYFMATHGAMYPPFVQYFGEWYTLFTSMFLHFGFAHLFGNMLVLFFLGDNLERAVGHVKYLAIYLGGGIAGNLLSLVWGMRADMADAAVSAGASGAIFAVIGALVYIVARNRGHLEDLSTTRLLLLVAFTLYQGLSSTGVDNAAHIGGFLGGILLAVILYRKKKITY